MPNVLPAKLVLYKQIIEDVIRGDLESLRRKIEENEIREIVHIRGVNHLIEDLPMADEEEIETAMWNPLHFAVYH